MEKNKTTEFFIEDPRKMEYGKKICMATFVVRLFSAVPLLALADTSPRNTELIVLNRLDFPAATWPRRRMLASDMAQSLGGLYISTADFSSWAVCSYMEISFSMLCRIR